MLTATSVRAVIMLTLSLFLATICAFGEDNAPAPPVGDEPETVTVEVTARRWEEPLQEVPGSVSVITSNTLESAGISTVNEAAPLVPNLTLPEFSARWLSFPFIRGVGSGRNSPAVMTVIDGVPQLSFATTNQELLDAERIEFLRGPQGSLYGRNALGGVVNVIPRLPSDVPEAYATVSAGNYDLFDIRGGVSGPLGDARGSVSLGHSSRDGYTINDITGNDLDDRSATFGRAQVLWPEVGPWSLRLSATAQRDRDGSYALGDLAGLRARPHRTAYDFEGFTERDLAQPVFTAIRRGRNEFTSITAYQRWDVSERTDIDLSSLDLLRRATDEDQWALIQDFRLASPTGDASERLSLRWLLGLYAFTTAHDQQSSTEYRPDAVNVLGAPLPFTQTETARRRNSGVSPYGQATLALDERVELTAGLRYDFEHRTAHIVGSTDPVLMPPTTTDASRDFNQLRPQVSLAYHLTPDALWYGSVSNGFKTGGFNAQAPPDAIAFDEETSRTYETGVKTAWFGNRLVANLALFRTAWDDIQLDVPAGTPGVFYIDNAGAAVSRGGEFEVTYRALRGLDLFGGIGILDTEFKAGSQSAGADVGGNELPFAPRTTWHAGAQCSRALSAETRGFARLDLFRTGAYFYDAANNASEDGYTLVNLRLGVERGPWRVEAWARNLFNADYVPVAFPFALAPSGYAGESGTPRTVGVTAGYRF